MSSLCILRLSSIGDVCHLVAVVKAIKEQKPHMAITWIIGKAEHALLKGLPGVEFIVFDKSRGLREYYSLRRTLKGRRFDTLFHMQRAFRTSIANLCIKADRKIGWDRERAREGQWLFNHEGVAPQKNPHVIDGFFAFAQALGVSRPENLSWDIPIPENDAQWVREKLSDDRKTLLINPAASNAIRNWSAERYAQIASHVMSESGWTVVLSGGPAKADIQLSESINALCGHRLMDLTGTTSLKQLLALIQYSDFILAPDTGPLHMAATVGTPALGLYAHSNPRRTGPVGENSTVVSIYDQQIMKEYGSPWTELRWGKRAKSATAMNDITFDTVWQTLREELVKLS